MFNGLMKSEIKKAESKANEFYGRKDCKVSGYYATPSECEGFYDVYCEISFNYDEPADHEIVISAMLCDRRRSFATVKTW